MFLVLVSPVGEHSQKEALFSVFERFAQNFCSETRDRIFFKKIQFLLFVAFIVLARLSDIFCHFKIHEGSSSGDDYSLRAAILLLKVGFIRLRRIARKIYQPL